MVKPGLAHKHSYQISLIQRRSEFESSSDSESESGSESEKNWGLNQSLIQTKIRV